MRTKLLKIFAVLLMTATALGSVAQEFSVGDIKYKIYGGFAYCTGLTTAAQGQSDLTITIPSVVSNNGSSYRVMGVDAHAFEDATNIKSVNMRFGVGFIESCAFKGCTGITFVRLPSSLKTMLDNVFQGCTALRNVYYAGFSFPQGTINSSAFPNNSGMTLYIPIQSLKTPADYKAKAAFSRFANVYYSNLAFDYYSTEDKGTYCIGWPDSYGATSVRSATLTGFLGNTSYIPTQYYYNDGGFKFSIDSIGTNAFQGQTVLKTIDLTKLTALKYFGAQEKNQGIQNVTQLVLPNSYFSILSRSFLYFDSLTEFDLVPGGTSFSIYDGCLYNYNKSVLYKVPNAKTGEMDYPSTLKIVWSWSHCNCTKITHAMLPYGVTSVSTGAFYNTTNLQYVRIPSSVTSLSNDRVFRDSKSTLWIICNMATPPTVTASTCFGDNSNMRLYVPYGKTSDYATAGWTGFSNVNYLGKQAYDYPDYSNFSNMIAYTVTSNASVTGADGNNYYGRARLVCNGVAATNEGNSSITVPPSVTIGGKNYVVNKIGEDAFNNRTDNFTVSGCVNIDTIGANAFRDQAITSYAFTHNLYCIEDYAFYGSGLTGTVALPYGVARLGSHSFANGKYSRIIVPNSIGYMFGNFCTGTTTLSELVLNKSGNVWYNFSGWDLTGVPSTCKILVPTGVVNQYKQNSKLSNRASYISAGAYDYAYGNNYDGKYFLTIISTSPVTFQNSTYAGKAKYVYHPNIQNSTSTGNYGFSNWETDMSDPDDLRQYLITEIGDSLLYGSKYTGGYIPAGVTRIGQSAFRNCAYAAHPLFLPNGLTFIGHDAFYQSKIAGEVIIPNTVTTLESYSLCAETLTSILFPDIPLPTMGQRVWSQSIYAVYVPNYRAHLYLETANSWSTSYGNKIAVWITPDAPTMMFSSVVPTEFSGSGAKAYYASAYNKNNTGREVTMTETSKAPANTGLLLTNLNANSRYRFDRPSGSVTPPSPNYLVATPTTNVDINSQTVGYYWNNSTPLRFVKPTYNYHTRIGGAYLKLSSSEASGKSEVYTNLYPAASGGVPGDVNGDGIVTAADVTAIYDWLLNNDASNLINGDVNGDGLITSADVTAIYDILLGN
jgi:hypothetical protein